jgi:oxygen-independent coproporphyrinogen-3 oxidase
VPGSPPLGLYVHVPYCRTLCPYCDFFSLRRAPDAGFVDALRTELAARIAELERPRPATTLYLGGGTPSLLPPAQIARLIAAVATSPGLAVDAEVTLEANPGDLDDAGALALRAAGVGRLSLGVQSLHDRWLRVLGRRHDAAAARAAVRAARRAGFASLSVDLILAIPGQDLQACADDVDAVVALGAEHVSTYVLSVEDGTPLAAAVARGEVQPIDDDRAADMLELACARLAAAGYRRYEISNHARPGHEARHNRLYWSGDEVLGLGPGAHSHLRRGRGGWRHSNPDDVDAWLRRWRDGQAQALDGLPRVDERLPLPAYARERLFLGLRDLLAGVDVDALLQDCGVARWPGLRATLDALRARELLRGQGGRWVLSPRGRDLADAVARIILAVDSADCALSVADSCEMFSRDDA